MHKHFSFWLFAAMLIGVPVYGATVYNEAVLGDLSNNGLNPTPLTFTPGSNEVRGTTGANAAGVDRDYFTFTVPTGYQVGQLIELAGTQVGDNVSFLGLEGGPQLTLSTNASSAAGLLGWSHYAPVAADTDLLPFISVPNDGSSGFSALSAGQYTVWIQDFSAGNFAYAFDVQLTATPEPSTYTTSLGVFVLLACFARNRFRVKIY